MARTYLALGTNLGDKQRNLAQAIALLSQQVGQVVAQSAAYCTTPEGFVSENTFLNGVVALQTPLELTELLHVTKRIEQQMGRTHKSVNGQYADRIIDIDILLYGNTIFNSQELTVPHPHMTQRRFVMEPLYEIAPQLLHPTQNQTISALYAEMLAQGGE